MSRIDCKFLFFKRIFSSVAHELGASFNTEVVARENVRFFGLTRLDSVQEALSAPEGSVVVVPQTGPTQFEIRNFHFIYPQFSFYSISISISI